MAAASGSGETTKPSRKKKFSQLGIDEWLIKQCDSLGIKSPTFVQENCIPPILKGRDCIGCAKTGSGKTAAFALPILQKLSEDPYGIYCLVLTPTRELAFQIADQFRVLGKPLGVRDAVITGGMGMIDQGLELSKKPHIVIATPGRIADHLRSCDTFSLKKIKFLVIDEADRLLQDNYGEDLNEILAAVSPKRQTLLFSATITDTLQQLRTVAMQEPFYYEAPAEVATVETLTQHYVLMPPYVKDGYLVHIIQKLQEEHEGYSVIVFTNTCKNCELVAMMLTKLKFSCVAIHSKMSQRARLASLAKFKSNVVKVLIATDVASRGLDIPMVQLILNLDIPESPKTYIHRVGRTARAGRGGMAITFVTQFEVRLVHAIEERINTKLTEYKVSDKEVTRILSEVNVTKRACEVSLDEQDFDEKKEIYKRKELILEGKDPDRYEEEQRRAKKKRRKMVKAKIKARRSKSAVNAKKK
ncbi:putative ATP-dependent RNA helicase ddx49 [Branchiostoma belcheri]|nr:putative ATP-dependent RNA helicase ddx49 [Branchiostoma belcheri]